MSYFTMSLAARQAAQVIWVERNNAMLQMSCFTRLMEAIDAALRPMMAEAMKGDEASLGKLNDVLAHTIEAWRQREPSLAMTASDEFGLVAFPHPSDPTKLEVTLSEALVGLSKGAHAVEMLAPTSPEFVGEAVRSKVSPMQLWRKRYGEARF